MRETYRKLLLGALLVGMIGGALLQIFVSVRGGYVVYFLCIVGWALYRQIEVRAEDESSDEPPS